MLQRSVILASLCLFSPVLKAVDWSEGAKIPVEGRANILQLEDEALSLSYKEGLAYTLHYPVEVTGLTVPYELLDRFLVNEPNNPIRKLMSRLFRGVSGIKTFDDLEALVGLNRAPDPNANPYQFPLPLPSPSSRLGTSFIETPRGRGVTFSCAACHTGELFGVVVPGLSNRFPRANEFFGQGKKAMALFEPHLGSAVLGLSSDSRVMLSHMKKALQRIEAKDPARDGLDTSLAHVALSLSHRNQDEYASPSGFFESFPRSEPLRRSVADSKPAPWWNVKYKNRWLLDGSVVSGNPIYTNLLWNEIGRGVDLQQLELWLDTHSEKIDALTSAVFASKAPVYTDFFPAEQLSLSLAKQGQALFQANCSRCHGSYDKAWDLAGAEQWSLKEQLRTYRVRYFSQTPVIDVGTDAARSQGMASLLQLNQLKISQNKGIRIEVQKGYVPPPLEGIWARWPYFHNNSVPSLCAVLTKAADRPTSFYMGEARDREQDFDQACNGYPLPDKAPAAWKRDERRRFDVKEQGLSNRGHDEGIFLRQGEEIYSPEQKLALLEFLKTL